MDTDSAPMNKPFPCSLEGESVSLEYEEGNNPASREVRRLDQLYYKMDGKKTAIIINMHNFSDANKIRTGSKKDVKALEETFILLKFKVIKLEDQQKKDLLDELDKLSAEDYKECDCLVVVIMTHGYLEDLYCIDGGKFTLKEVEEKFLPGNCPELAGKPKLFFVQACRGASITETYVVHDARGNKSIEVPYRIPKSCDVLEFFSTEEGCSASRGNGSWFIQSLAKNLKEYGYTDTLLNILTLVIHDVAISKESNIGMVPFKQQPVLVSKLSKMVKFE